MIKKIISGGQTGADTAGLDIADLYQLEHGGFCPKGRRRENMEEIGPIPNCYNLIETKSPEYPQRTKLNVINSDGTIIFFGSPNSAGSNLTVNLCILQKKPFLVIYPFQVPPELGAFQIKSFLDFNEIKILNVAGGRESKNKGIYAKTYSLLDIALHLYDKEEQ